MKILYAGLVLSALLSLLAAQGGYSVVWDQEIKRPEAQKAISEYLVSHCTVVLSPNDTHRIVSWGAAKGAEPVTLNNTLRCRVDDTGK
jgi:hypothetical protein